MGNVAAVVQRVEDLVDLCCYALLAAVIGDGNRQFLPIVWIQMNVAPSVCTQELSCGGRVQDSEDVFYRKVAA